jgi:hypothetical protein
MTNNKWQVLASIVSIENAWIRLTGEYILDDKGRKLTYWRIDRTDSVIIIPIHNDEIILPKPFYRHGIKDVAYDFPGGRHDGKKSFKENACQILERELGISKEDLISLVPVNDQGWSVDSSFSSQRVFVFEAVLKNTAEISLNMIGLKVPMDKNGVSTILEKINCIQCRCTLLDWMRLRHIY